MLGAPANGENAMQPVLTLYEDIFSNGAALPLLTETSDLAVFAAAEKDRALGDAAEAGGGARERVGALLQGDAGLVEADRGPGGRDVEHGVDDGLGGRGRTARVDVVDDLGGDFGGGGRVGQGVLRLSMGWVQARAGRHTPHTKTRPPGLGSSESPRYASSPARSGSPQLAHVHLRASRTGWKA